MKDEVKGNHNSAMRSASDTVHNRDKMVSFFYSLMRDCMTPGAVEEVVQSVLNEGDQEIIYTNGWLAKYAEYIVVRLRGDQ